MPNSIRTKSGKYLDFTNPDPDSIVIEDIAHALSHMPRFGGQLPYFYSVAQHSIMVAQRVERKDVLAALLHDASEAYMMDIPGPLKDLIPQYKVFESKLMAVIAEKFRFEYPLSDAIKEADKAELEWEWNELMIGGKSAVKLAIDVRIKFMSVFNSVI